MLWPNIVPRSAQSSKGGGLSGWTAIGPTTLRPTAVSRRWFGITGGGLYGVSSDGSSSGDISIGTSTEPLGPESSASTTALVMPVKGPGGASSERSFLSPSSTFTSSTTVGPE